MTPTPFPQSFWAIEGLLCAGHYPGDREPETRDRKLNGLLDCGIRRVLNLMEAGETGHGGKPFEPYEPRLHEFAIERGTAVDVVRLSLRDARTPTPQQLKDTLEAMAKGLREGIPTYLHCWGGHGRTSTVLACWLIQQGHTATQAIDAIRIWRRNLPKKHYPFEFDQAEFVRNWKPTPEA